MRTARPIIFGEVLFDHFPDGTRILGGAPFNVAWHLQGLGESPLFISAVGDDAEAQVVRRSMRDWGMDLSGLQTDPVHPTGAVRVELENGHPRFHILDQQAYDHIDPEDSLEAVADIPAGLLYHGSLILRHHAPRAALDALTRRIPARFVDVNLRPPWTPPERVEQALAGARWVKLNQDELRQLSGGDSPDDTQRLRQTHGLELVIVTLGERGALLAHPSGLLQSPPPATVEVVDTVGAGDAFSAVALLGLMRQWPLEVLLARAVEFAAAVCALRGATTADPEFYAPFRRQWQTPTPS